LKLFSNWSFADVFVVASALGFVLWGRATLSYGVSFVIN